MPFIILCLVVGFLLSFLIGRICIPRIVLISKQRRILDIPNGRKVHDSLVPRLGGISFLPAIMISYCFIRGAAWSIVGVRFFSATFLDDMLMFLSGIIIIYALGAWDDIAGISYKRKLVFQLFAAILIVMPSCYIDNLQGVLGIGHLSAWTGVPLTLVLILMTVNSFNLIDGVDGLCSGLAFLTVLLMGGYFFWIGSTELALFCACCMGILVSFFLYNVSGGKYKIFMGDCGSLTLGYIIAFLMLQMISRCNPIELPPQITLVSLLGVVFVPLFDTTRVFMARMCAGRSPFSPDKTHIHHKFLRLGYSHIQTTVIIVGIQAVYAAGNFLLADRLNINLLLLLNIVVAVLGIGYLNWRIRRHENNWIS